MNKNPNDTFISIAKWAVELCEVHTNANPGDLIVRIRETALIANMAALAKIALEKEAKTVRDSNGRPVVDLETDGRGVDAFFSKGTYDDDGSAVSDDELDYLTETYPEILSEESHQHAVCAAEYACEGDR